MTSAVSSLPGHSAEKRRVALHSMLAAAAMTLLKLAAGLFLVRWVSCQMRPIRRSILPAPH